MRLPPALSSDGAESGLSSAIAYEAHFCCTLVVTPQGLGPDIAGSALCACWGRPPPDASSVTTGISAAYCCRDTQQLGHQLPMLEDLPSRRWYSCELRAGHVAACKPICLVENCLFGILTAAQSQLVAVENIGTFE